MKKGIDTSSGFTIVELLVVIVVMHETWCFNSEIRSLGQIHTNKTGMTKYLNGITDLIGHQRT